MRCPAISWIRYFWQALLLAVVSTVCICASADATKSSDTRELRYDLRIDVPLTLGLYGGLAVSEMAKRSLVSAQCRWCDRAADGQDSLNGLDRAARKAFKWADTQAPDATSYVTAFILAPVSAFGLDLLAAHHEDHREASALDALILFESTAVALALDQSVKFIVQRERPFVHFMRPEDRAFAGSHADDNVSFFSGHTTAAFALAASAGTVAELRRYRMAPVIWGTGLSLAFTSGYLRMAADRHYLTDVLTGMFVGSAVGVALPILFHGRSDKGPEGAATGLPLNGMGTVSVSGLF